MTETYHHPVDVLGFACKALDAHESLALVIVTHVTGGAMRAAGAMMCVTGEGDVAGYVSNGCVDADIIFQAKAAIADGASRHLVYGEGSPFRDIELPCGGRIDLRVFPNPKDGVVQDIYTALSERRSGSLVWTDPDALKYVSTADDERSHLYQPKLKLRIVGRGEAVVALARQSVESGFDVHFQSPEPDMGQRVPAVKFDHLTNPHIIPPVTDDPWTAVVIMFHDHAWEPEILRQALSGDAFYIGAMGSPRTHANRVEMLRSLDISDDDITRIKGPIGLIPSMRDANLLALSTLAEIVSTAQDKGCL